MKGCTMKLDELALSHSPHPVCPYCGAQDYDWWEWSDKTAEQENDCGKCGETYIAQGEVVCYWTTWKPKKEGNHDGTR